MFRLMSLVVSLVLLVAASAQACDGGGAPVSGAYYGGSYGGSYGVPLTVGVDECFAPAPVALAVPQYSYQRSAFLGATPFYGGSFLNVRRGFGDYGRRGAFFDGRRDRRFDGRRGVRLGVGW